MCGVVCVRLWGSTHTPPPHPLHQHSHISSSVPQRQGAPAQVGHSGSICCYYFPLIIGLNNGMPVSPLPLKPYTLFIFQRSHFCSPSLDSLSPLNSSLHCLPLPSVASPLTPSHSTPMHLRGFHMKMTFLTGHISMCHSASDTSLQVLCKGAPLSQEFPPTRHTSAFLLLN